MREEYQCCNDTLRKASESQVGEIQALQGQLRSEYETHRKEKSTLDEQLVKDKFTLDACQGENRELLEAKVLLEQEREGLYSQLRSCEAEMECLRAEVAEGKRKVKKLELILYGRK